MRKGHTATLKFFSEGAFSENHNSTHDAVSLIFIREAVTKENMWIGKSPPNQPKKLTTKQQQSKRNQPKEHTTTTTGVTRNPWSLCYPPLSCQHQRQK